MHDVHHVSALGSVYCRETPQALWDCLSSLGIASEGCDVEVILVQDGPIGPALLSVIEHFRDSLNLVDVVLPENVGLGRALNAGLASCSHELVARFDTDDLYTRGRFALQAAGFEGRPRLAVLGGWIEEFESDPNTSIATRRTPIGAAEVAAYARIRCPVNHMTVMFRKGVVEEAGLYGTEHLFEDYALWARILQLGYDIDNLPQVLAHARVGSGMYRRRGGWRYARSEFGLLWQFWCSGFISARRFVMSAATRLPIRVMPVRIRRWVYQVLLRSCDP